MNLQSLLKDYTRLKSINDYKDTIEILAKRYCYSVSYMRKLVTKARKGKLNVGGEVMHCYKSATCTKTWHAGRGASACDICKKREGVKIEMKLLSKKQLEDATRCNRIEACDDCAMSANPHDCLEILAQTALAYRETLAKVLQVMEGFDYRKNINFTLSECIGVEMDAKALLKESEVEEG